MRLVEVIQEMAVQSRPFTDEQIQVGDPATYFIGTDSYGCIVTEVSRFKSGARAGKIREILTDTGERFRSVDRGGRISYQLVREGRTQWFGQVVVGFQRDYRDPHI
jgi:hypothetical protein